MSHSHSSLRQFYAAELQPSFKALEAERVRVRNLILLGLAIAIPVIGALWWLFKEAGAIGGAIATAIIVGIVGNNAFERYRIHFKEQIVQRLVQHYQPDFIYQPKRGISKSEFLDSQIYRHRIDRYHSEDLLLGKVGATAFQWSEIHAEYKTTTQNSKGGSTTHWHTIFKGFFFIADFNKSFRGETLVLPDNLEGSLGSFGQALQGLGAKLRTGANELVKLEDPEFERSFVVYSTDQIEARYILSTSLMQRLIDFRQHMGSGIAVAFINNCVYIAIPTNKNYFEPPSIFVGSAHLSLESVQEYLEDIQLAQGIVEDLNLNLRIWAS